MLYRVGIQKVDGIWQQAGICYIVCGGVGGEVKF